MTGSLSVKILNIKNGFQEVRQLGSNIVVNGAKVQMAHLIAGDAASRSVTKMQFGTGSMPEFITDAFLQSPLTPVKAVVVSYPIASIYRVQFDASILADEMVGFTIAEAGLLSEDDTLVARKTFAGLSKTDELQFMFYWTIEM